MQTILVPTDFSDNANHALQYAAALANQVKAKLIIAHIIHLPVAPVESGMVIPPNMQIEQDFANELNAMAHELRRASQGQLEVDTICQYGYLTGDLNEIVKSRHVNLVVMGTKGATGFLDKLIGTNSSAYSKAALCPVLIIPANAEFKKVQHLVYASDFEGEEGIFLRQLFTLAHLFGAQVSIVNVVDNQELNVLSNTEAIEEVTVHFPGVVYSIAQIRIHDVVKGLHQFAMDSQADILAVSMHRRNFFDELFRSQISQKLIYHTTLPLLTLPEHPFTKIWEQTAVQVQSTPQ